MLSLIVTWCNRRELAEALPSFVALANAVAGEIILVNFGGSSDLVQELIGDMPTDKIVLVDVPGQAYFNKACAQNIGARHATQPVLFFCDCDIILEPALVANLAARVLHGEQSFATIAQVRENAPCRRRSGHISLLGYELKLRRSDGRTLNIVYRGEEEGTGIRMAPGLLVVRRNNFLAVRGYNSNLAGWGWESQDIICRLVLGLGLERIDEGTLVHLSHDEESRIKFTPVTDRWENRDRMFRQAIANYYAGDFYGTYSKDIATTRTRPTAATH